MIRSKTPLIMSRPLPTPLTKRAANRHYPEAHRNQLDAGPSTAAPTGFSKRDLVRPSGTEAFGPSPSFGMLSKLFQRLEDGASGNKKMKQGWKGALLRNVFEVSFWTGRTRVSSGGARELTALHDLYRLGGGTSALMSTHSFVSCSLLWVSPLFVSPPLFLC